MIAHLLNNDARAREEVKNSEARGLPYFDFASGKPLSCVIVKMQESPKIREIGFKAKNTPFLGKCLIGGSNPNYCNY